MGELNESLQEPFITISPKPWGEQEVRGRFRGMQPTTRYEFTGPEQLRYLKGAR